MVLRAMCEAALVGAGGIPTVLMGAAREPGRCSCGTRVNNAESARAPRAREPGRFTRPPPVASSWPPVAMEAGLDVGGAARWLSLWCGAKESGRAGDALVWLSDVAVGK